MVRVALLDDRPTRHAGLAALLADDEDVEVVAKVRTVGEARSMLATARPDVLVVSPGCVLPDDLIANLGASGEPEAPHILLLGGGPLSDVVVGTRLAVLAGAPDAPTPAEGPPTGSTQGLEPGTVRVVLLFIAIALASGVFGAAAIGLVGLLLA